MQDYLAVLKAHITQRLSTILSFQPANPHLDDWSVKGKFPAELKPVLAEVALKAIELGEYDDDFFNLMPTLFPYNRFTMMVCFYSFITFIRLVLTLW